MEQHHEKIERLRRASHARMFRELDNLVQESALYWSETGEIACQKHTPFPGSDTWNWDGWRKMTADEHAAMRAETKVPIEYESCRAANRAKEQS